MNFRRNLLVIATIVMTFGASLAMAEDHAVATAATSGDSLKAFGAAIALGLAVLGGAIGQAKTATAALEGIARNPAAQGKIFVPMIISLALIESLVLYAFVIAFVKI